MADFSLLPEDVLINILLRLPIKYVFRSRSVCKNWNFLLQSHKFSSLYHNHQLCKQERLANDGVSSFIVLQYVENDYINYYFPDDIVKCDVYFPYDAQEGGWFGAHRYDCYLNDCLSKYDGRYDSCDPPHILLSFLTLKKINNQLMTTIERVEKLDIIFNSFKDRVFAGHTRFLNVYEGIICLENKLGVILYNPYTRESQRLPFRPCTHRNHYRIVLGLWIESNGPIKHYKVFSLLILQNGEDPDPDPACTYVIEKYDSIEGSWTKIKIMPNQKYPLCRDNCLLFNGILHLYVDDHNDSLITLDVRSETLGLLSLPIGISEWNIKNRTPFVGLMDQKSRNIEYCFVPHLFVLKRTLAMFAQNTDSVSCIDIWMMIEYGVKESWTKQYTIPQEEYFTVNDFDPTPSKYYSSFYYGTSPCYFKLRWRLLLNWKFMDEDEMILETRKWSLQPFDRHCDDIADLKTKLVSFNLFSNKLTDIDMCDAGGNLLSVVPFIETILSLK